MATVTTRSSKGSALTSTDYDDTINALNNDKLDTVDTTAQTVASDITFNGELTLAEATTVTAALSLSSSLTGTSATFNSTVGVTGLITATGGITSGGNIISDTDSTDDLGTTGVRWANLFVDDITATTSVTLSTMSLATGSITDSSGAISFGDENLSTTGSVSTPSLITASGAMTITPAAGSNLDIVLSTTGDFTVNTSDLVVDTSSGSVGFGIEVPEGNVHIFKGDISQTAYTNANQLIIENNDHAGLSIMTPGNRAGYLVFADPGSSVAGYITYNHNNPDMRFYTENTLAMTLDSSQNVGIGQSSPVSRLHISEAASTARLSLTNTNTGHTAGDGFSLEVDTSSNAYVWQRESAKMFLGTSGSTAMTIDSSQNVTVTNGNLEITGTTEATAFVDAGSTGATQQDWIEVTVGGVTGYIHVYAAK